MQLYTLTAVEKLQAHYIQKGGSVIVMQEGTLLDDILMRCEGLKTIVATAVFLSEWNSAYKVRQYNVMPKKYEKYTN